MARDPYNGKASGLPDPAGGVLSITPDDDTDLSVTCRALYVGQAGDVKLRAMDNTEAIFAASEGSYILVRTRRVLATGTTATGLVGLY
ncbi:hypothetical protein [Marivita sp.]|uniref:spike base protein, RCAP_Rcc01079 family n=1 Tax=Marivita sp. TaxID=2003365 RepID=UPI0025BEEBD7|nr:hypothetical protein [Marivita sp.]